jgi:hypothetical protein
MVEPEGTAQPERTQAGCRYTSNSLSNIHEELGGELSNIHKGIDP